MRAILRCTSDQQQISESGPSLSKTTAARNKMQPVEIYFQDISNRTHWTDSSTWVSNSSSNFLRGPLVRSHSMIDGIFETQEWELRFSRSTASLRISEPTTMNSISVMPHLSPFFGLFFQAVFFSSTSPPKKANVVEQKSSLTSTTQHFFVVLQKGRLFPPLLRLDFCWDIIYIPPSFCWENLPPQLFVETIYPPFYCWENVHPPKRLLLGHTFFPPIKNICRRQKATWRPWRIIFKQALLPALMKKMPRALVA